MAVFDLFCGNASLKQQVAQMVKNGRLFHAYLLEGENGLGKKTFARYMAAAFLCRQNQAGCGECEACQKVLKGIHPDVELLAGSGSRSLHVEEIRKIRSKLYIRPNEGDKRVYILANAEDMTAGAQNALLKSLEEPPVHTIFILTSENRAQLLPTVLSRLIPFTVTAPSFKECVAYISAACPEYSREQIEKQALLFENNIGKTIKSLSSPSFGAMLETVTAFIQALCAQNSGAVLKTAAPFEKDKALFQESVRLLQKTSHLAVIASAAQKNARHPLAETLQKHMPLPQLAALETLCEKTLQFINANANHLLLLTWFTAQL